MTATSGTGGPPESAAGAAAAPAPAPPADRRLRIVIAAFTVLPVVLLADLLIRGTGPGTVWGRLDTLIAGVLSLWILGLLALAAGLRRIGTRVAGRILLVLGAVLFTLAAVEGALRIVLAPRLNRVYARRPLLRFETRPSEALPGIHGDSVYTTNSLGLRGPEPAGDEDVRILTVGGSTTECVYLDDTEDWSALLDTGLEATTGRRVWVGNAGAAGFNSMDHLRLVEALPEVETAHWVVVLCGWNDLCRHVGRSWESVEEESLGRATFSYSAPPSSPLVRRSVLFFHLRETLRLLNAVAESRRVALQDPAGRWVEERRAVRAALPDREVALELDDARRIYADVLERLAGAIRRRGGRPVFLTQPTLCSASMSREEEELLNGFAFVEEGYRLPPATVARAMASLNEVMVRVAAERDVPCVRLDLLVPSTMEYFYDDCHFNEGGAKAVAKAVVDTLAPLVRARAEGAGREGDSPPQSPPRKDNDR